MEYQENEEDSDAELTDEQKREKEKEEVEGKLKGKLINSSIANTEYINNVLQAYVLIAKNMNLNYTMKRNISLSIVLLVLFSSCSYIKKQKAAKKMQEYTEYKDLHEHQGTENYEVISLLDKDTQIYNKELFIDKKQKLISIIGDDRLKIDFFGNVLGKGLIYKTLKDGTMSGYKTYSNWFINGDTTKYKYIDPFTNKAIENPYKHKNVETDFKKWLEKFKNYYSRASYVKREGSSYYLKINKIWYFMELKFPNRPKDFVAHYPTKISPEEIRMVQLTESMEPLIQQGVIKVVAYIEQDSERGVGLNPINFSSGYYMLELHLPQGDTLKFRRYGARGFNADLRIYQIPKELGGSNEVFFIEQIPRQTYPNKSFAGFYAIRPKNYTTLPEYQPYLKKEQQDSLQKRRSFLPNK